MDDDRVPRVLGGPRATTAVTALSVALISGAAYGAWTGGLFEPPDPAGVTVTTVDDIGSAAPQRVTSAPPVRRQPALRPTSSTTTSATSVRRVAVTVTSTSTSTSTTTSTTTGVSPVVDDKKTDEDPSPVLRTDCPSGMIPDDKGGCVVDHSYPSDAPPPTAGERGGPSKPKDSGKVRPPSNRPDPKVKPSK